MLKSFKMPYIDDGFEALLEPFYNGKKLTDPISTVDDKNQLLPAFLKVKGMLVSPILSDLRDIRLNDMLTSNRSRKAVSRSELLGIRCD